MFRVTQTRVPTPPQNESELRASVATLWAAIAGKFRVSGYLHASVAGLVAMTFAQPGYALSWICERDSHARSISVDYPQGAPLPCQVIYDKSSEGLGVSTPWSATGQDNFCEAKAQDLVERHAQWGWNCTPTESGTETSSTHTPTEGDAVVPDIAEGERASETDVQVAKNAEVAKSDPTTLSPANGDSQTQTTTDSGSSQAPSSSVDNESSATRTQSASDEITIAVTSPAPSTAQSAQPSASTNSTAAPAPSNSVAAAASTVANASSSIADREIRKHVTNFVYDVKFYLWKNAQGALPGDVFSETPVAGDIDLDGSNDFAFLYTIENHGGATTSNQYLHVFLRDGEREYRPASNALYSVANNSESRVTIERIEDGMIYLSNADNEKRVVKLLNDRLIEIDASAN